MLNTTERFHGAFERFTIEDICHLSGYGITTYGTEERVLDALHVMVPVTVHQVGDTTTGSLGQVIGILLDNLMEGNTLDDDDMLAVRRELKPLNLSVGLG